ncbi:MAG: GpE family phage tail protein [Mesorhizobium sp.]|nr:GpE family phage tail protein [Mesorhizobium sp.]RWQ35858.1 MAG: GpE family phage tail protein [Mesorhizobium sp.]
MADIAVIFHWPPSEMWEMDLSEIVMWRKLAAERARAKT